MNQFRILLALVFALTSGHPLWAVDGYNTRYEFPTSKDEVDRLVPGQWYERILPDGSVGVGYIMGPDSNPTGENKKWFEIIGKHSYVPKRDGVPNADGSLNVGSGGNSSKAEGPKVNGPNIGTALQSGAIAGVGQVAIQGIYNAIIMTPSRQTELENTKKDFDQSSSELRSASHQLEVQFAEAFREAAKAVGYSQSIFRTQPGVPAAPLPVIVANEIQQKIGSAPIDFQREALPIFSQLNGVRPRTLPQLETQSIGNAALETAADAAIQGDLDLANTTLGIAKQMANLLVGLDPVTGTARFGYELFSGKNMITHEELGPWERAFSGAAFAASLVTLGTSSTMIGAVKGCLEVVKTMKGAGLMTGLATLRESKKIADTLRNMGWVEREVSNFSKFNRTVINGTIKDLDYGLYAYKNWTAAARSSFPKVLSELKMSAEEVAIASKEFGIESATLLERRAKAIGFYNNTAGFEANANRIGQHLKGIDFAKSVDVVKVEAGLELHAWHVRGAPIGNYATRQIVPPSKLGVGSLGRVGPESGFPAGTIMPKEARVLQVTKETYALESTAKEFNDLHSLAPEIINGRPIVPKGELRGLKNKLDIDVDGVNQDWLQFAPGGERQLLIDFKALRLKP